jgi:hypothetical protein
MVITSPMAYLPSTRSVFLPTFARLSVGEGWRIARAGMLRVAALLLLARARAFIADGGTYMRSPA